MSTPTVDIAERGRTTIAERVVAKVAARAASEVERAAGTSRQFLGITIGSGVREVDPGKVDVTLDGDVALVHVNLSVRWPAPVLEVAHQVRQRVTERVGTLTGLTVAEVDIDVTALPTATTDQPRVR